MYKTCILFITWLVSVINVSIAVPFPLSVDIDKQAVTDLIIHFPATKPIELSVDFLISQIKSVSDVKITKNALVNCKHTVTVSDGSSSASLDRDEFNVEAIYDDGFRLTIGPGILVRIEAVNPLGLIFGLTELMERMGFRFYMPGPYGTVYPERDINLGATEVLSNPAFAYRCIGTGPWSLLAYRANVNLEGPASPYGRKVWGLFHTFGLLLPAQEYQPSHPEYFAQRSLPFSGSAGERQLATENPQVVEIVAQKLARLSESKNFQALTLSPSDHRKFDFSFSLEHLAELLRPRDQMVSERMSSFYNRVARRYEQLGGDTPIRIGAYDIYTAPPEGNTNSLNKLLIPYIAHFDYCQLHPISDVDCQPNMRFSNIVEGWAALSKSIHIYEYPYKHNWLELPWPVYVNTASNLRYLAKHGARGYHAQFSEANAFSSLLNYYITAKALWNPSVDCDSLRKEFLELFYKEASGPMNICYTLLEDEFRRHPFHVSGNAEANFTRVFSRRSLESALAVVDKAASLVSDPVVKVRVSMMRLWLEYSLSMSYVIAGDRDEARLKSVLSLIETAEDRGWPIFEKKHLFKSRLMKKVRERSGGLS
jgi:hypothetical protein